MNPNNDINALIRRYNVAAPRYTSYPTVPYWDARTWDRARWSAHVQARFRDSAEQGISLYVHLPFCERLCTYCGCHTRITKNHGVEAPYVDAVLGEWRLYRRLFGATPVRVNELHLGGGTPTFFAPQQLRRLVAGLLEGCEVLPGAALSFEAHPANTTAAHLETLFDLGFRRLSLGIQDFDPQVQEIINRKQTVADVQRVVETARGVGYRSINFDLIYGLPLQTLASVRDTVEKALSMRPERIAFYSYAHVPWMKPGQRRYTEADLPSGKAKLDLYHLGKQLIGQCGYYDVGMDHFVLPGDTLWEATVAGKLHRNFMGYTDRYTPLLIGLGVSSIGDAWTAFAQNEKKLEAYLAMVKAGEFPVVKGHVLSEGDLTVRQHILDLMCRGTTVLDGSSERSAAIRERLGPLLADNLAVLDGPRLKATALGRSFIRNICMAFDERLHDNRPVEPIFSKAV